MLNGLVNFLAEATGTAETFKKTLLELHLKGEAYIEKTEKLIVTFNTHIDACIKEDPEYLKSEDYKTLRACVVDMEARIKSTGEDLKKIKRVGSHLNMFQNVAAPFTNTTNTERTETSTTQQSSSFWNLFTTTRTIAQEYNSEGLVEKTPNL